MTTHKERIQTILNGEKPDRPGVALWRHFPMDDQSPETLAAATLNFQQIYNFDIVKVSPSSSFLIRDWGVEDKWLGDTEGTRKYTKRVIDRPQDWEKLKELEPSSPNLAGQLACLRLLRRNLSPETPMIQTIFSPMAQAKNLAGSDRLIAHLRLHPEALMKGLEIIAKSTSRFLQAALETGIDGIFYAVQHAQASLLTWEEFKTFSLPNDRAALEPASQLWCNMLHLHGRDVYFSIIQSLDFHIVNWHDRETYPTLAEAGSLYKGVLCGGLRQNSLVFEDQAAVKNEAADAIQQTKGQRFILGTGCVVPVIASHGNLMAARKSVDSPLIAEEGSGVRS